MHRFGIFVILSLISTVGYTQKFFSWPIYENSVVVLNETFSDIIYLRDSRSILKYSKQNCSAQEIANDIAISLQNNGITKYRVIPCFSSELKEMNCIVLDLFFFYSYLNFNIWDSRVEFQLISYNPNSTRKFDLVSAVNSESNNWGHKSGQKALKYSFDAAMNKLIQQLLSP
jgi:hypothetical protein